MLESRSDFIDRIDVLENPRVPSVEDLRDLTASNCRFTLQWDDRELSHRPLSTHVSLDLFSIMGQSDEIRERIVDLLNEFCNELEKAVWTGESARSLANPLRRTRDEEMKWMENNKELLIRLAGKWIAVEGSSLVAADKEFSKVSQEAKSKGIAVPFIVFVPEPESGSTIGI